MIRVTCAPTRHRRHRKIVKLAKGYYGRRKNCYRIAKQSVEKARQYAYIHRRKKKGDFRSLWIMRINAACRMRGMIYSVFMKFYIMLCKQKCTQPINRKMLSELAICNPEIFDEIFNEVKSIAHEGECTAESN